MIRALESKRHSITGKRASLVALGAIALALVACAPKAPPAEPATPTQTPVAAVPSYGADWSVSPGWPGEYPSGFTVLADGVVVKGRAAMHPDAPQIIDCPLPKFANYQLWNVPRSEADGTDYQVATLRKTITVTSEGVLEFPGEGPDFALTTQAVKPGDQLIYTRYLSEGWAVFEYAGKEIEMLESSVSGFTDMDQVFAGGSTAHEWVQLSCADPARTRAWLFLDEVLTHPDIGPSLITGYGEANDLTEAELAAAREAKAQSEVEPAVE